MGAHLSAHWYPSQPTTYLAYLTPKICELTNPSLEQIDVGFLADGKTSRESASPEPGNFLPTRLWVIEFCLGSIPCI